MNYYKRHLGDYAAATRHLSLLEHGVYTLLLDTYYVGESPLPSEDRAIYRLVGARSKEEREAVGIVLQEFFELREDGWHQPRCDEEIAQKQAKAEINRDIGRRGGRPQKITEPDTEKNRNGSKIKTETVLEKNPSHKPIANNQKPIANNQSPIGDDSPRPPQAGAVVGDGAQSLPDWMPAADWQAFVEHRKRVRSPMTDLAQTKAIAELDRLRVDGHNPVAVINQSIINGWKGLFPLKHRALGASMPATRQEEQRDVVSHI